MGVLSVYLPTKVEWEQRAPEWAQSLWVELKQELEGWCRENGVQFHVDPFAKVYSL